jgi:hypothetical protein
MAGGEGGGGGGGAAAVADVPSLAVRVVAGDGAYLEVIAYLFGHNFTNIFFSGCNVLYQTAWGESYLLAWLCGWLRKSGRFSWRVFGCRLRLRCPCRWLPPAMWFCTQG